MVILDMVSGDRSWQSGLVVSIHQRSSPQGTVTDLYIGRDNHKPQLSKVVEANYNKWHKKFILNKKGDVGMTATDSKQHLYTEVTII